MNKLKRDQKNKVNEFRSIAGARVSNANAIEFLKAENWDLERAVDRYFNTGTDAEMPAEGTDDVAAVASGADALFNKFKSEEDKDAMDIDGVLALIEELSITPEDNALKVFAYHCAAANFSGFTRAEFVNGCAEAGISSLSAFKSKLNSLRASLADEAHFEAVYNFVFLWACEPGKKIMQLEGALGLWQQLFVGKHAWPFTEDWCTFLQAKHGRPVMQDTWRLLLPFKRANHKDLSNFDESQAWPTLIDEFVEWEQEKQA